LQVEVGRLLLGHEFEEFGERQTARIITRSAQTRLGRKYEGIRSEGEGALRHRSATALRSSETILGPAAGLSAVPNAARQDLDAELAQKASDFRAGRDPGPADQVPSRDFGGPARSRKGRPQAPDQRL